MTNEELDQLYDLLLRGASLAGACTQLGKPLRQLAAELRTLTPLEIVLDEVRSVLSFNVMAVLYQSAMKGSVPAQIFWMTRIPPPGWPTPEGTPPKPDPLNQLTTEELIALAREYNVPVPPELLKGDTAPAAAPEMVPAERYDQGLLGYTSEPGLRDTSA